MLFIEGVGGVMVPLDETHTVLDWMAALGLPVILVTGSYLGTISHTLSAMHCLNNKRLDVKAVVINDSGDGAVPMDETRAVMTRFMSGMTIATMPRVKRPTDADENFAALWHAIG